MLQSARQYTQVLFYDHYQGNVSSLLNTKIRITQESVLNTWTLGHRVGGSGGDSWMFTTDCSSNIDITFGAFGASKLANIRHWDSETTRRNLATWTYGDGNYNRPHSLEVQFCIKYL